MPVDYCAAVSVPQVCSGSVVSVTAGSEADSVPSGASVYRKLDSSITSF